MPFAAYSPSAQAAAPPGAAPSSPAAGSGGTGATGAATGPDATAEFYDQLNNPKNWVIKPGVPVFKQHVRKDPATGATISVDLPKLYRIAANMQRLERMGGVPVRMTLGHTEPGKPETQQPPVGGYYRNARVQEFGPRGEPAVVADEWLDPKYKQTRRNFPYRSAEYYDDTEQITGVALLTRDPYLDLGVVAYSAPAAPARGPTLYSLAGERSPATHYHLLLGDDTMWPHGYDPVTGLPNPAPPQVYQPAGPPAQPLYAAPPAAPGPVQYSSAGTYTAAQTVPPGSPTPYGWAPAPQPYRPAPARRPQPYRPQFTPAAYRPSPYADSPPMPGGQPGGDGYDDQGEDDISRMHRHMSYAVNLLNRYQTTGRSRGGRRNYAPDDSGPPPMGMPPAPPNGPYPPGSDQMSMRRCPACGTAIPGGAMVCPQCGAPAAPSPSGMGMPTDGPPGMGGMGGPGSPPAGYGSADSPYSRGGRPGYAPRRYSRQDAAYPAPATPNPGYGGARTLSGLPVGYQMQVDQLKYQLAEQDRAIGVIMYERDQADTQACSAEIGRLASMGYMVGDYEVAELKAKATPEDRAAYLQHVMLKYQKVGTDQLPPTLGDPTPHAAPPDTSRPLTKAEMDQALKLTRDGRMDYSAAVAHVKAGGAATQYGPPAHLAPASANGHYQPAVTQPPEGFDFRDPYGDSPADQN